MKKDFKLNNFIILFMRANPMPIYEIAFYNSDGTPMNTDSNGIHFRTVLDFFEMKRWMALVAYPKFVRFFRQILHVQWKFSKKFLETFSSSGFQRLSNPPSSKLPASISAKADAANDCNMFGELEKASSQAFSAKNSSSIKEAIQSCISMDSLEMVSIAFSNKLVILLNLEFRESFVKVFFLSLSTFNAVKLRGLLKDYHRLALSLSNSVSVWTPIKER